MMTPDLREHFKLEISQALLAQKSSDYETAWKHLGRAHILGQFFAGSHVYVHILMFLLALKTLTWSEIIGQIPRLILAAPGSWTKKAPKGNTGLSNVGIFQPMEIPADIKNTLNQKQLKQ